MKKEDTVDGISLQERRMAEMDCIVKGDRMYRAMVDKKFPPSKTAKKMGLKSADYENPLDEMGEKVRQ